MFGLSDLARELARELRWVLLCAAWIVALVAVAAWLGLRWLPAIYFLF